MTRLASAMFLALLFPVTGSSAASTAQPAPSPPQSIITVLRSQDKLYEAIPAIVELNETRAAALGVGQSFSRTVRSGPTTLTVSAPSMPGRSTFRFSAEPGIPYRFLVSPRAQDVQSKLISGIVTQFGERQGLFVIVPIDVD